MANDNKHITIPKKVETGNDLDYSFLRAKGQEYIEQLAANYWTDYNTHDPGVTMLEMLCYAITDLGNRINLPIEDILKPGTGNPSIEEQFYSATEILPSKPISETDYRKLFIDIDGIKNCWLKPFEKTVYIDYKGAEINDKDKLSYEPFNPEGQEDDKFELKGLHSLVVDLDDGFTLADVEDEIRNVYHQNRNLCEDLVDIKPVETHPIAVCAKIEVEPEANEEKIYAEVALAIERYFSPEIRFYSLKQMYDSKYKTDEIFEGPLLNNGFINPAELQNAKLRTEVRLSDIMQLIMKIKGVKVITEISITDCNKTENNADEWRICIDSGKKPAICAISEFSYFKGVLPLNINKANVEKERQNILAEEEKLHAQAAVGMELQIPEGEYVAPGETTTIQNDFPEAYGIGLVGVPAKASDQRKAQAKQLKAYLIFFDQILASYFKHLEKVKEQLSVDNDFITDTNEPRKTYFTQAINDLKGIDELLSDYPFDDDILLSEKLFPGSDNDQDLDNKVKRNNVLLDHLIARFAEKFSEYSFLMKELYGDFSDRAIIATKESFLKDYPLISSERGLAFNYTLDDEVWGTSNVSGFQKRLARLAGIMNFDRRNLSESFVEIYIEDGEKPDVVYRWRIRNEDNEIILSATDDYASPRLAEEELQFAVVKILETSIKEIETAFSSSVQKDGIIGNLLIRVSDEGLYSFDIINREMPESSVDWIIARQYSYYTTSEELKIAMLEMVMFMTNVFSEEGMFLVEHILLRPDFELDPNKANTQFMQVCAKEGETCHPVDPYSYRVTILLPGWTYRFANIEFRRFMETLIRAELPAHILARICWVGYRADYYDLMLQTNKQKIEKQRTKLNEIYEAKLENITNHADRERLETEYLNLIEELNQKETENIQKFENQLADLTIFEKAYEKYLTNLARNNLDNFKIDPDDIENEVAVEEQKSPCQKLINSMVKLNTIYQQGKLFDCDDETDVLKGRIILDQTNLGTL